MPLPHIQFSASRGRSPKTLLGRIFAAVVAVAVLVVGFMFSLAILAVVAVVGIVVFGWLWWKLRRVMRQMREDPRFRNFAETAGRPTPSAQGDVIEGEVIRGEWREGKDQRD